MLTSEELAVYLDAWTGKIAAKIALWFVVAGAALVASGVAAWVTRSRDVSDVQKQVEVIDAKGSDAFRLWRQGQDTTLLQLRFELRRLNERLDDVYISNLRRQR